jgi:hypothetical protein
MLGVCRIVVTHAARGRPAPGPSLMRRLFLLRWRCGQPPLQAGWDAPLFHGNRPRRRRPLVALGVLVGRARNGPLAHGPLCAALVRNGRPGVCPRKSPAAHLVSRMMAFVGKAPWRWEQVCERERDAICRAKLRATITHLRAHVARSGDSSATVRQAFAQPAQDASMQTRGRGAYGRI